MANLANSEAIPPLIPSSANIASLEVSRAKIFEIIGNINNLVGSVKGVALAASTGNLTLLGEQTVDNVSLVSGDLVLVKNQVNGIENGLYEVATGVWTRTSDMPKGGSASGAMIFVSQGLTQPNSLWICSNSIGSDIIGTNSLIFNEILTTLSSGLTWKTAVVVATTVAGNINTDFENGDIIDGVTLVTDDRILIKDQALGVENGIYIVNDSGAPTRSIDLSAGSNAAGVAVIAKEGTVNADTAWVCTNDDGSDTVGVDPLTFVQFASLNPVSVAGVQGDVQYNDGLGDLAAATLSSYNFTDSATVPELLVGVEDGGFFLSGIDATTATSNGSNITITAGQAGATLGTGGDITIVSGDGSATSGNSGDLTLSTGTVTLGTSGAIYLSSGTGTLASGDINISTGIANINTGSSGNIIITSSDGGIVSGNAGDITITAGIATGTGADGQIALVQNGNTYNWPIDTPVVGDVLKIQAYAGNVATLEWSVDTAAAAGVQGDVQWNNGGSLGAATLSTYNFTDSATVPELLIGVEGGTFTFEAESATTTNTTGCHISMTSGTGLDNADGGDIIFTTGDAGATGSSSGDFRYRGGSSTIGIGGDFNIVCGNGLIRGGLINLRAGNNIGAGDGGEILITSGVATSGNTGDITISTASNGSTGGVGNITISTGNHTVSGNTLSTISMVGPTSTVSSYMSLQSGDFGTATGGSYIDLGPATSTIGADITIFGGSGNAVNTGGRARMFGGDAVGANGGAAQVVGGFSGNFTGGGVLLQSGSGNTGGDVQIIASTGGGGTNGNIYMNTGGVQYQWPDDVSTSASNLSLLNISSGGSSGFPILSFNTIDADGMFKMGTLQKRWAAVEGSGTFNIAGSAAYGTGLNDSFYRLVNAGAQLGYVTFQSIVSTNWEFRGQFRILANSGTNSADGIWFYGSGQNQASTGGSEKDSNGISVFFDIYNGGSYVNRINTIVSKTPSNYDIYATMGCVIQNNISRNVRIRFAEGDLLVEIDNSEPVYTRFATTGTYNTGGNHSYWGVGGRTGGAFTTISISYLELRTFPAGTPIIRKY